MNKKKPEKNKGVDEVSTRKRLFSLARRGNNERRQDKEVEREVEEEEEEEEEASWRRWSGPRSVVKLPKKN